MPATQCPAVYSRVLPGDLQPAHIRCTYIEGHAAGHSFRTLEVTDEVEAEELRAASATSVAAAPPLIQTIVGKIEDGEVDRYLELILSAGHDRKRARRGVPGFDRRQRDELLGRLR